MSTDQEQLLLRVPEAAARLSLGRSSVYELIAAGQIHAVHIGRAVRIPASEVRAYAERLLQRAEELASDQEPVA